MQAIILAAGMGKRLKELTKDNTKCMVKVNGVRLIDRMLGQLDARKLTRIVIVVGYEGRKLVDHVLSLGLGTPVVFIDNPIYDKTNNIYSLWLAKDRLLEEDTLLFESDLIFDGGVLDALVDDPRPSLALVDKYESWMDGTCIKIDDEDNIVDFIPKRRFDFRERDRYYKTVNIYKFSKNFSRTHYVPFLEAYIKALGENQYYEQVLKVITILDNPGITAKQLDGQLWYEIDDAQDLDIASGMFNPDEDQKIHMMESRYGGYWRYPKLLDFCYLVNPYFPPRQLVEEMRASFETLLTQYPSGMAVNSLLAAKNFGVRQDHILVGNGAAELIKCLMEEHAGNGTKSCQDNKLSGGGAGFVRPTFEEYPNRCPEAGRVEYVPANKDFRYDADDVMRFFEGKGIKSLVLVNPDNPTGNYIDKQDTLRLARWTRDRGILFVVDESFVDFADEEDASLINESVLNEFGNLFVMKSISKCCGVPGLRLGVLASSDSETIAKLKKEVSIWNINSFGEFYMQIAEKYKGDYAEALGRIKAERKRLFNELGTISGLRPVPSQANYILVEIVNGSGSRQLAKRLLVDHDIFIKDLSKKIATGQYVRIAVRDTADNDRLLSALRGIFS